METIKNYYYFLLWPLKENLKCLSFYAKVQSIFILLIFHLVLLVLFSVINSLLISIGFVNSLQNGNGWVNPQNYRFLILPLIVSPVFEEVAFRLWLDEEQFIPLSLTATLLMINLFVNGFFALSGLLLNGFFITVIVSVFSISTFIVKKYNATITKKLKNHTRFFVFFSAILFGYLHITHFKITPSILISSPIVLAPFICMGLLYGYIKIRFGFGYAVVTHGLYNLIVLLDILLK